MSRYWTRIGLGALLIFVLGFAGLTVVRRGSAEVRSFLATTARKLPLQLANLGFRLDGRRVGDITELEITRNGAADAGRITGQVRLTDAGARASLSDCALSMDEVRRDLKHTTFYCASQDELQSGRLVEVGEMRFEPGAFARPLYLPEHHVSEWRRSNLQGLQASLEQDGHGGVRASGRFDVRDRGESKRGSFDLRADSQGALLSVRDEHNRSLIHLRADQGGLSLRISDRQGRSLFRMIADSLGVALKGHK